MSERYRTQRIKRWGSRSERVQNPYWLNPSQIELVDLEHLSRLSDPDGEHDILRAIEDLAKAGGDMLLIRDMADRAHSGLGRVVGLLTFAIVPVLNGRKLTVTEIRIGPDCHDDEVRAVFQAELADIAKRNDIRHLEQLPKQPIERRVRSSGISAVKTAERLDQLVPDDPKFNEADDGPPTKRLGIPLRNKT